MSTGLIVTVIVLYFLVLVGISYLTSRGATNDAFFTGERKSPWYLVAFGMVGASLSGVTFISVPGWVAGGQFGYMQIVFGYFFGYLIIAYVLMPIYYRMNLTSIYEYLESRFGFWSYKTGAVFFLVSRLLGASIRLLLVATVLQEILLREWGVPFEATVVISVALIWVYTNRGGIKTIIWTDTLQTAFMLVSAVATVYVLSGLIDFDSEGVVSTLDNLEYTNIFSFDDPMSGGYFWKAFLGGIFISVGMTGLDQDMMQKNLSCKNLKEAKRNMVSFAAVLVIVNLLFLGLGALLYLYNAQSMECVGDSVIASGKTDLLFSTIALHSNTGIFVGILFLLGLIAAAYSSADSALTSLTTSVSVDFLKIKERSKVVQEKLRKKVHLIVSLVVILTVIILRKTSDDSAIMLIIKLAGFTYGPLIGIFFFGILTKRKLRESIVLPVMIVSSLIMILVWWNSNGGKGVDTSAGEVGWLGSYFIGPELIVYNALLAFMFLFAISYREKQGS